MLPFDNMAVNIKLEKPMQNMMMDYTYTKLVFLILLQQTVFKFFRLFFKQLFSSNRLGNDQNDESLPLLCHYRDSMES